MFLVCVERCGAGGSSRANWASPRGRPATPFKMIEQSDKRVVFENAEHEFPHRIIYWMTDDGSLHAKIEGTLSGKPAAEEWSWQRTAL